MGAIASGGVRVMTPLHGITFSAEEMDKVVTRAQNELLRREQLYRSQRSSIRLEGRTVIVVDDGLATGATMHAAVRAIRQQSPFKLVVAVPVGAPDSCAQLRQEADALVCAAMPSSFRAVSLWYKNFTQTSDDEVISLLEEARHFPDQHARTQSTAT